MASRKNQLALMIPSNPENLHIDGSSIMPYLLYKTYKSQERLKNLTIILTILTAVLVIFTIVLILK